MRHAKDMPEEFHLALEYLGIFPNEQEIAAGEKICDLTAAAPAPGTGKQQKTGLDEACYRDILEDILLIYKSTKTWDRVSSEAIT